jgi:DNA-binding CsgD family transcriptional regulator
VFAARASRELLATGETVCKRTAETLEELTPEEGQIARLGRRGQTNPEIGAQLSSAPHVEWHLRKVFAKFRDRLAQTAPRGVAHVALTAAAA